MNGLVRQSMQPNIQQQFPPQPMGILTNPQPNRGPYPPQSQPRAPNGLLIARPPQSAPPAGPLQTSASVGAFPAGMMGGPQGPPQGPAGVRRVPSQPHMSMLGGLPTAVGGVAGGMPMSMGGLGPQTTLPLRQGQPQTPQQQAIQHQQQQQAAQNQQQVAQQQQQQLRIQHQHQQAQQAAQQQHMLAMNPGMGTPDMGMLRGQPSGGGLGGGSIARTPSAQNQVMSSLSQPPTPSGLHPSALGAIGGVSMGMPPPHHGVSGMPSVSPRQRTGAPSPRPGAIPSTNPHSHQHANPYAPHANSHSLSMSMGGVFSPPMNIGPNPSPGHGIMAMPPPPTSTNLGMPPSSTSGPMGMPPQNNGMPPTHHTPRTPRMTPDNAAAMAMGLYGSSRPGSIGGGPGGPGTVGGGVGAPGMYSSGPFVGNATPPMSMVGVTGNEGVAQGGTPNRTNFLNTPAEAYEMMNGGTNRNAAGAGNTNITSSNAANGSGGNPNPGNNDPHFSMPPPSNIPPPRPSSHATNPNPGTQTPQQAHQQAFASQQAAHQQMNQHAINQQQQQHGQPQPHGQPHHPSHAHAHPPHQLGTPQSHQQQQQQQQHAQQQHAHQQQQQQHGSPPGNDRDVQMGTPGMHPPRPQSQPQRPPSQASRTPRAGPTPIPGSGPGVGGMQQHPGSAPPPAGVSTSSSSSSSVGAGGGVPGSNGSAANSGGSNPLFSGPSALGNTPLTQTGIRQVPQPPPPPAGQGMTPMHGMGAFGSMGGMSGMGPMGSTGGMNPNPHPSSVMGMGGMGMGGLSMGAGGQQPPPPPPPNANMLGGVAGAAPRPGGPGGGGGPGGAGTSAPAGPPGPSMAGTAPAGPGAGGAAVSGAASVPPLRAPLPTTTTMAVGMGQGVIRLLQFSGVLSGESKTKLQLHWWSDLVKEYFTPKAVMKLTLWRDSQRNEAKPFEIGVPILPRFFLVTTQSGVKSMSFTIDGARERSFGQGHSVVECVSAVWTYRYTNGYTVTLRGPLTVHVIVAATGPGASNQALKFEDFQFDANLHDKYIASDAILGPRLVESPEQRIASVQAAAATAGMDGATSVKQEEEEAKWDEPRVLIGGAILPGEPVNAFGIPQATMRCLELAESVSSMTDLIAFAHENGMGPKDSLKVMAQRIRDAGYPNQPAPGAPGGPPTLPTGPPNGANANTNINTSLGASFSTYPPPGPNPPGSLYSSAPPSVINPPSGSQPGASSSMNSPGTASSSANSPEKQLKTIPQQQQDPSQQGGGHAQASGSGSGQQQGQGQAPASASSPAISSGGTTNTPALSNTSLKRKQAGDASSPTVGNPDQPKRGPRKRVRAGTTGAG